MTYELRRLRLHGFIQRLFGSNTYLPTPTGSGWPCSFTKVHDRLLAPLLVADRPWHPAGSGTRSGSSTKSWPTPSQRTPMTPMTAMPARWSTGR
jgi:hypothetical protein